MSSSFSWVPGTSLFYKHGWSSEEVRSHIDESTNTLKAIKYLISLDDTTRISAEPGITNGHAFDVDNMRWEAIRYDTLSH